MGLYGKINRLPGEIFGSGHLWMVVWVFYTVQEIRCLSDLNFATVHKIGPRPSAVVYGDSYGPNTRFLGAAKHAAHARFSVVYYFLSSLGSSGWKKLTRRKSSRESSEGISGVSGAKRTLFGLRENAS